MMMTGQPPAGGVPAGYVIFGENVMVLPPFVEVMERVAVLPDLVRDVVSEAGLPGSSPAS